VRSTRSDRSTRVGISGRDLDLLAIKCEDEGSVRGQLRSWELEDTPHAPKSADLRLSQSDEGSWEKLLYFQR
jgi:hypothetical protein